MPVVTVPKALREKLGEDGADRLVEFVNGVVNGALNENKRDVIELAAERFERRLAEELGKLRVEMHDELGKLRAEIIKWMFLFWLGQAAVVLGLFLKFR
ncbi:MAG: hypothetical protein A3G34_16370 [Candidatus Lindowbacteria bacterium RIFCSPLOWO2_12_FULL_62_27]|nr:MAG: hypothetical protein A3G34_16370 [Candidatus Lindowbacteria bacterium RIFCSPLOWO2_12_FULL_62_27]